MGTTGGNTDDMIESLELTAAGRIDPAVMVTHIGGLDAAAETTLNLPNIPGGKKLIYTHIEMPLIALDKGFAPARIGDQHYGKLTFQILKKTTTACGALRPKSTYSPIGK